MIRQKSITIKIENSDLLYSEMGDVVCNSEDSIIVTLPLPNAGLWYRISNVGSGIVSVYYNSTLTTLKQTEQCLCLANKTSNWFFSKGGGAMTKEEIETILTGEIISHTHPFNDNVLEGTNPPTNMTEGTLGQFYIETITPKLYYCSEVNEEFYTWIEVGGNEENIEIPQATATELGGIRASPKTSGETQEVKIDIETGKLYSTPPSAAQNGLPAGGSEEQVLSKIDETDYNAQWVDVNAKRILSKTIDISDFTGLDGYLLAYDENEDKFYLKKDEGGGGGDIYSIRTLGQMPKPTYWMLEPMLSSIKPNPSTYLVFQDIVSVSTIHI